ncbi:polysaccharide pyruvyl transferase family protein [Rhodococcus sp. ARC_M5]|uniref:polysaccharide pyruvyl transferase family protein n=1 Tax=Rhodococcus sp. ARC_M5 TaxID=2928851 RepID=UPI001FB1ECB1|nr:polysaccharide pyruvyl transferase family protein [Rhodococcus sp. ARC_M5]MCJ0894048.1 polysaccharide pyruvyl transferase family protein [Rhodococcus sp. ARC_M5]
MTQHALNSIRDDTRAVLHNHIHTGDRIALLDFPIHENAGDSLIYAGERRYFGDLQVRVDYLSDIFAHSDKMLRKRIGDRTIFLHGGGNFGDRWPLHQEFRERIVSRFTANRIVALPQGIDYARSDALKATAEVYGQHPDLTLLLRERRSYEIALSAFPENRIEYCPDLAFGASIARSPSGSKVDVVKLFREDSERLDHGSVHLEHSSAKFDWGQQRMVSVRSHAITLPTRIVSNFPKSTKILYPALVQSYGRLIRLNLSVAQRILNFGSVVLTDRLHAAVLAAMMGKQVVAMDNANQKVSGIYDAYLHRFDNVRFASNVDEAAQLVSDAVARAESMR